MKSEITKTSPPREILSERLLIRIPTLSDSSSILSAYAGVSEAVKYLSWPKKNSEDEVKEFIERVFLGWEMQDSFTWVVTLRETASIVGCIAFRPQRTGYEIGYVLSPNYWAKGLGTELVERMIEVAFEDNAIHRVWAYCDTENLASVRLLEKVGMSREGLLQKWGESPNLSSGPRDQYCYAIVR